MRRRVRLNAFGKGIGLEQLNELGNLETPIALTNTLNAPLVADAIIEWSLGRTPGHRDRHQHCQPCGGVR